MELTVNKTVADLAQLVGGKAVGDASLLIDKAATLKDAGPADISFLGNQKYADAAAASRAGCLLLPLDMEGRSSTPKARIFVDDPQFAFSQILSMIVERQPKAPAAIDPKASVHYQAKMGPNVSVGPFAVIERGAAIAEGASIGAHCYIGENAKVGRFCKIYPNVVIREDCVIGDRTIIQPGAVIGGDGFGFSPDKKTGKIRKLPQVGNVVVGEDVEIGANVTIDRAAVGSTLIGAGTKIDNLVQIAHGVKTGQNCILVSQVGVAGSTELGNHVVLGGQVGLVGHIKIGDFVQVGAQSGIMNDVPAKTTMFGYPAKPHREAFKLQVLYNRLPELFDAVKQIKEKLGIEGKSKTEAK